MMILAHEEATDAQVVSKAIESWSGFARWAKISRPGCFGSKSAERKQDHALR